MIHVSLKPSIKPGRKPTEASRKKVYERYFVKLRKFATRRYATFDRWLLRRIYRARDRHFPPLTIISLPKSGSVYLQTALRRTLRIPMIKFDAGGTFDTSLRYFPLRQFAKGNALTRVHMLARPHLVQALRHSGILKIMVLIRDPRDAIISWSKHVDRNLTSRGITGAIIDVEMELPDDFADWTSHDRLRWQIKNTLPRFCEWIQGWVDLSADSDVQIEFFDFADMAGQEGAFVERVLRYFGIDYDPAWVIVPDAKPGRHNITSLQRSHLDPDLQALADSIIPTKLLQRFNWDKR
ncbi:sulfotransferase domain-containing protein [Dongia rigui]|uniref:Sulfotransferase domain-containing protein n=1 Tax=Dongia rigui TaxID=940149 RepID=A0ABU5E211_9PROT|nr:sulfotransferase domain-containing protein [Dongia rigui]MDY0873647.1 sulfotransferase domain-containing protein [Dongia rigui]